MLGFVLGPPDWPRKTSVSSAATGNDTEIRPIANANAIIAQLRDLDMCPARMFAAPRCSRAIDGGVGRQHTHAHALADGDTGPRDGIGGLGAHRPHGVGAAGYDIAVRIDAFDA